MPDIYISQKEQEEIETTKTEITETEKTGPAGVRFENQEEEEKIILLLRRHWVTNVSWILLVVVLIFAPLILPYFPLLTFLPWRYQSMAIILWYLLVTAFIFEKFLSWYFNVYIVTDQRIIDYDFYNLLYKDTTEADIEKIQDVSAKMRGVAQVIFNFGDILIETAGAIPNLEFEQVPNPTSVAKIIHELRDKIKGNQGV